MVVVVIVMFCCRTALMVICTSARDGRCSRFHVVTSPQHRQRRHRSLFPQGVDVVMTMSEGTMYTYLPGSAIRIYTAGLFGYLLYMLAALLPATAARGFPA